MKRAVRTSVVSRAKHHFVGTAGPVWELFVLLQLFQYGWQLADKVGLTRECPTLLWFCKIIRKRGAEWRDFCSQWTVLSNLRSSHYTRSTKTGSCYVKNSFYLLNQAPFFLWERPSIHCENVLDGYLFSDNPAVRKSSTLRRDVGISPLLLLQLIRQDWNLLNQVTATFNL